MIGRRLLMLAARRLAEDPRVRQKAAETAEAAWNSTAPKVENAGRHVAETFRETREEVDLLDDPVGFARRFRSRLLPPEKE